MNTAADVAFVKIFNFVDDTAADTIMKQLTIQIFYRSSEKSLAVLLYNTYMYIMPTYGFCYRSSEKSLAVLLYICICISCPPMDFLYCYSGN